MKIVVVGAKLQGLEIVYLAKKAGYYSILIDKNENPPAKALADEFHQIDIFNEEAMMEILNTADALIPALENEPVLLKLLEYQKQTNIKFLFDMDCYKISSSKKKSNELFKELKLPMPKEFPDCKFPMIAKPNSLSGSAGVKKINSQDELESLDENYIVAEYLEGDSYSLEVIGDGEKYYFSRITQVIVDENYDAKRIVSPANVDGDKLYSIGKILAEKLKIKGIFDIEVIDHNGEMKLLEIDARFPSQTPISIFNSCGLNLLEIMVDGKYERKFEKVCYYQQIEVNPEKITVLGEHIISDCKAVLVYKNMFGADEIITDYKIGEKCFNAIVIVTENSHKTAYKKFLDCIENIKKEFNIPQFIEG